MLNPGDADEQRLDRKIDALPVAAGARLLAITPGGGGWGDPFEREPGRVAEDLALGHVSRRAAYERYGVVTDAGGELDTEATEGRRREHQKNSDRVSAFDRGERFERHVAAGDIRLTVAD